MCVLVSELGTWDFNGPGFTAITHPASLILAKNHGVFILEDMISPWAKYRAGITVRQYVGLVNKCPRVAMIILNYIKLV